MKTVQDTSELIESHFEDEALLEGRTDAPQQKSYFIYVITCFAAVGGFLFGFDTGVVNGAILLLEDEYNLDDFEIGIFVSIALFGAIIGSICGGPASDKWGRRPIIGIASILFTAGSVVLGAAFNRETLFIGRFIVGLGIGIAANIVPIYVAEIAPAEHRGTLVTVNNLCITSGQFISYLVDYAFVHVPQGWRYMLGLAAIPAVIQLIGIVFIVPESPRWLVSQKRTPRAVVILRRVRGEGRDIRQEIREIESSVRVEGGEWKDLLSPSVRNALILGVSLQAFQQFCGINTAMYYSAKILKMAGFEKDSEAILFSNLVAFTNAMFTVVAMLLIDRVGRRKLLTTSLLGISLGLGALGASFFFSEMVPTGWMAVISLVVYVAFFAVGMGPIPWAVNSEIYPQHVRGLANGVATTVNWTANLIISISFLPYIDLVTKAGAFWTYAGISLLACVLFFFTLPETKGKSIEEIQNFFAPRSENSDVKM